MADGDMGQSGGLQTGLWSQAIQALNRIATELAAPRTSGVPGTIQSSAGSATGTYLVVATNGGNLCIPLYNLS